MANLVKAGKYKNLNWVFYDDGTLRISGKGSIGHLDRKGAYPWTKYAAKITDIVLEDGVTSIGRDAFGGYFKKIRREVSVTCIRDESRYLILKFTIYVL